MSLLHLASSFASSPNISQVGLAQMLKGGVIMDVTNAEEARIAEEVRGHEKTATSN